MEHYMHRVVGIYPTRTEAEGARGRLVARGLDADKVKIFSTVREAAADRGSSDGSDIDADSDDVLKEVLRDGAIGTVVGTAVGAHGTAAIVAANVSLFIASPLLGPLSMLGWGAALGGIVGAVKGAQNAKGDVADLVRHALADGNVVLVAHTESEDQTDIARTIIGASMVEASPPPPATAA
jgi:hypothetical protein